MKNIIILLLISCTSLVSCKKKDSNPAEEGTTNTEESKVIGRWNLIRINSKNYKNDQLVNQDFQDFSDGSYNYVFSANKKVTVSEGGSSNSGTYSLSANRLIITASFQSIDKQLTWINGDKFSYIKIEIRTSGNDVLKEENELIFQRVSK